MRRCGRYKRNSPFYWLVPNRENSSEYKAWRDKVSKADGQCCQWPGCGKTTRLQIHHIRRWADCPELRFDVNNGITLCAYHHRMIKDKEREYEKMFFGIVEKRNATGKPVQTKNTAKDVQRSLADIRAELRKWEEKEKNQ